MSVIRIEFVRMGSGVGMDSANAGDIKEVLSSQEVTAGATATLEADWVGHNGGATHAIITGVTGNTIVDWDETDYPAVAAAPDPTVKGKLVLEGSAFTVKVRGSTVFSFLERAAV